MPMTSTTLTVGLNDTVLFWWIGIMMISSLIFLKKWDHPVVCPKRRNAFFVQPQSSKMVIPTGRIVVYSTWCRVFPWSAIYLSPTRGVSSSATNTPDQKQDRSWWVIPTRRFCEFLFRNNIIILAVPVLQYRYCSSNHRTFFHQILFTDRNHAVTTRTSRPLFIKLLVGIQWNTVGIERQFFVSRCPSDDSRIRRKFWSRKRYLHKVRTVFRSTVSIFLQLCCRFQSFYDR